MAEELIQKVSIGEVKAARALLGWSQEDLAAKAKISIATIKRLEAKPGRLGGRLETAAKIEKALKDAGVRFVGDEEIGFGVTLRPKKAPARTK
jgi:ribosome-binding protein aMBF1 (putative translation factor)